MDQNQHDQLKTTFKKIDETLNNKGLNLSQEEKTNLEQIKSELAGSMLSSWLPVDSTRKIIMMILFLIGLYGIVKINFLFILLWLALVLFSPRIVGEVTVFLGKMFKK